MAKIVVSYHFIKEASAILFVIRKIRYSQETDLIGLMF